MARRANRLALTKIVPKIGLLVASVLSLATFAASCRAPDGSGGKVETSGVAPQELLEKLAEVARSTPPVQARGGDHSIRGRVVTEEGAPLAGVFVSAMSSEAQPYRSDRPIFDDDPPRDTLVRALQRSATWWYARRAVVAEATTAADGTFVLDGLRGERFELQAWHAGFCIEPVSSGSYGRITVRSEGTVDFVASPCVRMRFELRLPDGSVPDRARLQLVRAGVRGRSEWETWTPAEAEIPLPAGDWTVTATIDSNRQNYLGVDEAAFASRSTLVTVVPSRAAEVVTLELRGKPAIEGTVLQPPERPRQNLRVVAVSLAPDEVPDPSLLRDGAAGPRRPLAHPDFLQSISSRESTYRIKRIEPGRWFVGLIDERLDTPLATAIVEVGEGTARTDFAVPPIDPSSELRLRVVDPDGRLLRDCELRSTSLPRGQNGGRYRNEGYPSATPEVDGTFALDHTTLGEECVLFVEHPRFGIAWLEVPAEARTLELQFAKAAVPTLRLTGYAEHAGHRRVRVEVTRLVDPKFERRAIALDATAIGADGAIELGRLQPGTWQIHVLVDSDRRGGQDGYEVAAATVELASGARDVELPFPALSVLQIAVAPKSRQGLELIPMTATSADDRRLRRYAEADSDGLVTFPDVPPGRYEIVSQGDRHMVVEAPAPKPIAFVAEAVNALRVVISDPNGELAKLGLKSDDAIVAIDGREFENRQQLDWIRQSLQGDEVTLTVQRAGRLFEVVVPRSFMSDGRAAGGRLREGAR